MSSTVGLAVSGGAPKGSYATGFLHTLFENVKDVRFDVISGTSTGALIGPMVAKQVMRGEFDPDDLGHELNTLAAFYLGSDAEDFFEFGYITNDAVLQKLLGVEGTMLADFLMQGSMVQAAGLKALVNAYLPDPSFYTLPNAPIVVQSTIGLRRKDIYYFRSDRPQHWPLMKEATRASAQQPVLMPLVKIETDDTNTPNDGTPKFTGTDWYCDGGVADYVPIRGALAAGATKVLSIAHRKLPRCQEESHEGDVTCHLPPKTKPDAVGTLRRTIDSLTYQTGTDDVRLALVAERLAAIRDMAGVIVDRVESKCSANLRNEILDSVDLGAIQQGGLGNDELERRLGLTSFVDHIFEMRQIYIPDEASLPKNDFDFSLNSELFALGQLECLEELERGLDQWLLT
jgi:predicted acylesterase/phospholipase RssA